MSNARLSSWIASSWPALRRSIIEHFAPSTLPATVEAILAFVSPLAETQFLPVVEQHARLDFIRALASNLQERIRDVRAGRRVSVGVLSRSRQLAVEDSVGIVERLIGEMEIESVRQRAGFKESTTISHPGELRGVQPEHYWEAVVTIIRERAAELNTEDIYITLELGGVLRQVRVPGAQGRGSARFSPTQVTRDALVDKIAQLFHSQTREQLNQDHLSDVIITADFFNFGGAPIRGRLHPLMPRGQNGVRGAAPDGEVSKELRHLKGLQALSRKGGYCALKPLAVALDVADCKARGVQSTITWSAKAPRLLQKAAALAVELGAVAVDNEGTFGSEVFQLFVDTYTDWRVVLVDPFGHVVGHTQGIWSGSTFTLPQQPPQGYDWANTVHICYDKGTARSPPHFYRIHPDSFGPFGKPVMTLGGNNQMAVCAACCERFTRASRAKHVCENGLRHRCEDCGWTMYADELERHHRIDDENPFRLCEKCGENFSIPCFTRHNARCEGLVPRCPNCNHIYEEGEPPHENCDRRFHCLNSYCEFYRKKKMDEWDLENHRCYIKPRKEKDGRKRKHNEAEDADDDTDGTGATSSLVHWAWDCEAVAEKVESCINGKPVIKFRQIVSRIVARCCDTSEEKVFEGPDCLTDFILWANFEPTQGQGKKCLWSHNGGKYDTRLLYDRVVKDFSSYLARSKSVFVGSKIFKLDLPGCTLLDSYNQIPYPLKNLPSAFGIDTKDIASQLGVAELKKGEFPYSFSTPENRNYVGRLPPVECYNPERRQKRNPAEPKDDDEQGLREWHAKESARIDAMIAEGAPGWNLLDEELEYCRMDVLILAESLKAWRKLNLECGNCDPLTSMTLASHAHKTFLTKHLKENSIPVLKAQTRLSKSQPHLRWADEDTLVRPGYKGGRVGPTCILYELTEEQIQGEWKINFYDFRSEYPSQMWNQPYPIGDYQYAAWGTDEPVGDPEDEVRKLIDTQDGMIACEIDFPSSKAPLFHPYLHSVRDGKLTFALEANPVINRDYVFPTVVTSLHSHRVLWIPVSSFKEHYTDLQLSCEGLDRSYVDGNGVEVPFAITLDEAIAQGEPYKGSEIIPLMRVRTPQLEFDREHIGPFVDSYSEYFGKVNPRHFIDHWEARVGSTCPRGAGCEICARFAGRALPTYTIFEVREALKLGYQLHHVYWTLSTEKTSRDLFKSYLKVNYEMKLKHSDPPELDWEDLEVVEEFVKHHADMGITIAPREVNWEDQRAVEKLKKDCDSFKIQPKPPGEVQDIRTWFEKSPALKLCGKLMMNSQYGKWGENSRKTVTAFVESPEDEVELLDNDGETMSIVGRAFYDNVAEYRVASNLPNATVGHTNVILAAYVTAYGRHLLFQQLHRFGDRVLYYDTDSIAVVCPPNADLPETGPYLGDLELEIGNIHSFVSTGSKTYALKVWFPCKAKHYKAIGKSLDELLVMEFEDRREFLELFGEGSLRWVGDHAEYEYVKQKNKGISINSNVSRTLNYALMKRMAQALVGDEDLDRMNVKVPQIVFQWERDLHEFYVYYMEKSVVPTKMSLKGVLKGGRTRYTIMPFGWERFKGMWPWEHADDDDEDEDLMDVDDLMEVDA